MVQLSAVCGRITDGTHQPPKFSGDGVPFIFVSNIGNGRIDLKTSKFITQSQHQELTQRCPVEPGDVLYTTVGSYGNAAQVLGSVPFAFQRHIAHLKPMRDLIAPAYLAAVLNSAIVRRQVDRLVRGVAQKTLNLAALKSVIVPLPALREQQRIVDILDRADALRAKRRASLALLDTLNSRPSSTCSVVGRGDGHQPRLVRLHRRRMARFVPDRLAVSCSMESSLSQALRSSASTMPWTISFGGLPGALSLIRSTRP